jgi:hypothetical protein
MSGVSIQDDDVAVDEQLPDLPTAGATLARHLESAVGGMSPDVISVELNCDRGSARLKFHAYKHRPVTGVA